jgi:MFS transporter, ACDE family, multidrug resistance protein
MSKLYTNPNLIVIFSITMISIMGVASLTPAFPGISKAFNISPKEVALLITVFTLPGIILTPILGVFADRYGRKKILVPSLILFAIAGTSCFFTRNFEILIILRFFQGCGAASLGSLNVTLIGDIFTGRERASAMGYNAAMISVGTAFFPVIGGLMATAAWYMPFLLPSLGVFVAIFVLFGLNNPEPKNNQTLKEYFIQTFQSIYNKKIIGIFTISLCTFIILYGPYLTYLPFIIGDGFNQKPYVIGIIMSFASLASFTTSTNIKHIIHIFPEKKLILLSCLFYFLSMISVPLMNDVWLLIIPAILFGIAQGANLPCVLSLLASYAPMNQRAGIMSMNGMILRLGQTLGPLIIVPVYGIWGITSAYNLGAVMALIMAIIVIFLIGLKKDSE